MSRWRFLAGLILSLSLIRAQNCGDPVFSAPVMTGALESSDIAEASGIAASWRNPGVFWTHNDGSSDTVYAIRSDGALLGKYHISKSVDDFEDIAMGPGPAAGVSYVYAGDIGSNDQSRNDVKIFRMPEPAVSTDQSGVKDDFSEVESFKLKYPSGHYDAEALMVDAVNRELFVVTKGENKAHIFSTSIDGWTSGDSRQLTDDGEIDFAKVSGGDISPSGRLVALRREDFAQLWVRQPGESVAQALQRPALALPVIGPPEEPNGEALGFIGDQGYITTSEGEGANLHYFAIQFSAGDLRFIGEPQITAQGVQFQISGCPGASVTLERTDNLTGWQSVASISLSGSPQQITDPGAPPRQAFYRLHAM